MRLTMPKKKCPKCRAQTRRTTLERHDRGETVFRYSCPKCRSRATRTVKMTSRFAPVTLLPVQLRIGDRVVDADGEWEVTNGPWSMAAEKTVYVFVQRPGDPDTKQEMAWATRQEITVLRKA
jgi:hypothetical protein